MKIGKYEMPDELYYNKGHCWARIQDDIAEIGYDHFGERLAGPIKNVELLDEEDLIAQNEPFGTLSSGKWAGKLESPVSGEILEVNEDIVNNPQKINENPYSSWLVKIKLEDTGEIDKLMKGGSESLQNWLNSEISQFEAKGYKWE
ncbi:MAG: glycine cleavage system protein H [Thermoplasmata archaeon]|nr:MAG: glycine cleavage system protein H [Thermoplasmata archaeon]